LQKFSKNKDEILYSNHFLRSLTEIFLCPTGKLSPYKIYLETDYLIENFVNDWYVITNMLEVSKRGK